MQNQEQVNYLVRNAKDNSTFVVKLHKDATPEEIKAEAIKQANEKPNVVESAVAGAGQGIGFNSLDELYGAVKGGYKSLKEGKQFSGEGGEYRKARDEARAYFDKAQETNPTAYMVGEIGGSLAVPMGVEGAALKYGGKIAAKLAPEAQTLGRAVAENAGYSALAGYGGSNSDNLATQATDTLGSGLLGGGIGGILHGASNAAKNFIFSPRYSSDPKAFAAEKLAEAKMRDMGKEGLEKGFNPFSDVDAKLQAQAARGENNLMMADYAGENVRDLIRDAVDTPNARRQRYKEVLDRRAQTNSRNIEDSLTKNLGVDENYFKTLENIIQDRETVAEPMFKKAFATDTPITNELRSVFSRPTMKELQKDVARKLADEGMTQVPKSRTELLHRIKLELDEQIMAARKAERNPLAPKPTAGYDTRTLTKLKNDFLNSIKNKEYKDALKVFSGKASLENALEDGKYDVLKLAPEEIAAKLKELSSAEQEMYRKGAARTFIDKLSTGKLENDRTNFIRQRKMYKLFDVIFPNNKQKGEFLRDVANEERKHLTRQNAQGNSKTNRYRKAAEDADTPANMIDTTSDIVGAAGGNPSSVMNLLRKYLEPYTGYGPKHKAAILDLAMSKSGDVSEIGRIGTENVMRRNAIQRKFENALAGPVSQFSSGVIDEPYNNRSFELYNR